MTEPLDLDAIREAEFIIAVAQLRVDSGLQATAPWCEGSEWRA